MIDGFVDMALVMEIIDLLRKRTENPRDAAMALVVSIVYLWLTTHEPDDSHTDEEMIDELSKTLSYLIKGYRSATHGHA